MDLKGAVLSSFPIQSNPDMGELLWSRDGRRFAFFNDTSSLSDSIYVVDVDGKNLVNVTEKVTINSLKTDPSGTGAPEDYLQVSDQYEKLMQEGKMIQEPSKPRWSPDSQRLAYFAQGADGAELRTVDITTLEHKILWKSGVPFEPLPTSNIAWSPDGRTLAFSASTNLNGSDQYSVLTQTIWLVDSDGSNLRSLIEGDESNELAGWRDCPVPIESIG